MRIWPHIITFIYFTASACILLSIGSANDILGMIGMYAIPIAVLHLLADGLRFAFAEVRPKLSPILLAAAAALPVSALASFFINLELQEKAEARGRVIAQNLKAYVTVNDVCPSSLEAMPVYDEGIPNTGFRDSKFVLRKYKDDTCGIGFKAPFLFYCTHHIDDDDWFCDD